MRVRKNDTGQFVDLLGVVKVPLEEVVLRPSLLPHAVDR